MYMYLFWASSTLMPSLLFNTCEVAFSSSFSSLQWHSRCASGRPYIFSFLVLRFFLRMRLWSLEPYDNGWGLEEKQNRIRPLSKQLESRADVGSWNDGMDFEFYAWAGSGSFLLLFVILSIFYIFFPFKKTKGVSKILYNFLKIYVYFIYAPLKFLKTLYIF